MKMIFQSHMPGYKSPHVEVRSIVANKKTEGSPTWRNVKSVQRETSQNKPEKILRSRFIAFHSFFVWFFVVLLLRFLRPPSRRGGGIPTRLVSSRAPLGSAMVAQPSGMLSYCNTMFLDVLHSDGLVVSAKGLGVEHVIFNLIQVRWIHMCAFHFGVEGKGVIRISKYWT